MVIFAKMWQVQDLRVKIELFEFVFGHNVSKNMGCYMKGITSGNQSGQWNLFYVQINYEKVIMVICAMCYTEIGSTLQENKD